VVQHAEILFFLFRDQIAALDLDGVGSEALKNTAELELGKISGVYSDDTVLDPRERENNLSKDEWLELIPLLELDFEVNSAIKKGPEGGWESI
jgi:hypothetical protein